MFHIQCKLNALFQAIESERDRMSRLMELLHSMTSDEFMIFCNLYGSDLSWLGNELIADVMAESGSLQVEDPIREESEMIVHKHFGTSRRLSEVDKKKIAGLISLKIQVAKDTWKRQLEKAEMTLELKSKQLTLINEKISKVNTKLEQFLRQYSDQIFEAFHSMQSTSDVLLITMRENTRTEKEQILSIDEHINFVLRRMHLVISERSTLIKEKENCLKLLKAEGKTKNLTEAVNKWTGKSKKEREEYEKIIKSLKKKVTDLEEMVNEREKKIELLTSELESRNKGVQLLSPPIQQLRVNGESISRVSSGSPRHLAVNGSRDRSPTSSQFAFPQIERESKSAVTRRWVFYGDTMSK